MRTHFIGSLPGGVVLTGMLGTLIAAQSTLALSAAAVPPDNKACGLVTPAELETAVGARVSLNGGDAMPAKAGVELCTGQAPTAMVMLRLFRRTTDPSGATEKAGIEIAKKMGAQVDVKTFGPITCSTIVPPESLAQHGFNTTCSVNKAPMFAVVEVTAKAKKDMVSIEKLHALAEKMAGRF